MSIPLKCFVFNNHASFLRFSISPLLFSTSTDSLPTSYTPTSYPLPPKCVPCSPSADLFLQVFQDYHKAFQRNLNNHSLSQNIETTKSQDLESSQDLETTKCQDLEKTKRQSHQDIDDNVDDPAKYHAFVNQLAQTASGQTACIVEILLCDVCAKAVFTLFHCRVHSCPCCMLGGTPSYVFTQLLDVLKRSLINND